MILTPNTGVQVMNLTDWETANPTGLKQKTEL